MCLILRNMIRGFLFQSILLLTCVFSFGQAYIPMPSDSATWRYRMKTIDDLVFINDMLLYTNGHDTTISGTTYHKIYSRSKNQTGTTGFNPPIVDVIASTGDVYYGGIRESGKKVYYISSGSEQLIFDFTAIVGTYIPAFLSTIRVTSIDSILISGTWHKRYNTTDSTYYVIEGVGSNRGLIPDLNDGSGSVVFHCFKNDLTEWGPDNAIPCTYVYSIAQAGVSVIPVYQGEVIYPNPAKDILHIKLPAQVTCYELVSVIGQSFAKGEAENVISLNVSELPRGIYYICLRSEFEWKTSGPIILK